MHQPLKFNTLNFNTYNGLMWELGDDQTDISMVCEKISSFALTLRCLFKEMTIPGEFYRTTATAMN